MHDLRRQALQGGKTVSRKARSRLASGQASAVNSRPGSTASSRHASRNPSRQASDDEDYLSDETAFSTNSIDEILNAQDFDAPPDAWKAELHDRIEQIIDRKRSSVQGREESLAFYTGILIAHYAKEDIDGKVEELVAAILKSVRAESSEKETILALKALSTTLVTAPSDTIYDAIYQPVKRTISVSESLQTKEAAIHALATAAFFGGASDGEAQEIMDFFLEIIESDGHSVDAPDDAAVVTAALEGWGFLATLLDEMEEETETAMEAFVEQLGSSEASVQIAAGENIALLYEKSYTEKEEDEELSEDEDSDPEDEADPHRPKMIQRYTVWRREDQLKHTLQELANISGRSISKKDKKSLHTNFSDILNSVENPTRGPRYQTAVDRLTGKRYGSRLTVKINQAGEMKIDKWWKLHRLKALRRMLQGGFVKHYQENEVVFECLPIMISKKY